MPIHFQVRVLLRTRPTLLSGFVELLKAPEVFRPGGCSSRRRRYWAAIPSGGASGPLPSDPHTGVGSEGLGS